MKIHINQDAYDKIIALVKNCPDEINGLARLNLDGHPTIDDVAVVKQTVTGSTAEHDTDDLMNFFRERREAGDAGLWRVQWHSHNNMSTFHSKTDTDTIEELGKTTDWLISLVFNKKEEITGRLDLFKPFRLVASDVELVIVGVENTWNEWAKAEIEAKVEKKVYAGTTYQGGTGSKTGFHHTPGKNWQAQIAAGTQHHYDRDECDNCLMGDGLPHPYRPKMSKKALKRLMRAQGKTWAGKSTSTMTDDEFTEYRATAERYPSLYRYFDDLPGTDEQIEEALQAIANEQNAGPDGSVTALALIH